MGLGVRGGGGLFVVWIDGEVGFDSLDVWLEYFRVLCKVIKEQGVGDNEMWCKQNRASLMVSSYVYLTPKTSGFQYSPSSNHYRLSTSKMISVFHDMPIDWQTSHTSSVGRGTTPARNTPAFPAHKEARHMSFGRLLNSLDPWTSFRCIAFTM